MFLIMCAIYQNSGTLNNTNNIHSFNNADGNSGGIYYYNGNINVENNTFSDNTAMNGGSFYQYRGN